MSRTYLQLCQDVVSDLGVVGGVIQSVQGNTSIELQRIVNWVARADVLVQNMWSDWNFLYYIDSITGNSGDDFVTPNKTFDDMDRKSLVLYPDTQSPGPSYPQWLDWERFQVMYQNKPKLPMQSPAAFSQDPAGKIWLSHTLQPIAPATTVPMQLAYWLTPTRMVNDGDTSPIPNKFDTIIVERAKILYAQRENAPEILTGSSAEFADLLEKMESSCLPYGRAARKSANDWTTNPDGYVL